MQNVGFAQWNNVQMSTRSVWERTAITEQAAPVKVGDCAYVVKLRQVGIVTRVKNERLELRLSIGKVRCGVADVRRAEMVPEV